MRRWNCNKELSSSLEKSWKVGEGGRKIDEVNTRRLDIAKCELKVNQYCADKTNLCVSSIIMEKEIIFTLIGHIFQCSISGDNHCFMIQLKYWKDLIAVKECTPEWAAFIIFYPISDAEQIEKENRIFGMISDYKNCSIWINLVTWNGGYQTSKSEHLERKNCTFWGKNYIQTNYQSTHS